MADLKQARWSIIFGKIEKFGVRSSEETGISLPLRGARPAKAVDLIQRFSLSNSFQKSSLEIDRVESLHGDSINPESIVFLVLVHGMIVIIIKRRLESSPVRDPSRSDLVPAFSTRGSSGQILVCD